MTRKQLVKKLQAALTDTHIVKAPGEMDCDVSIHKILDNGWVEAHPIMTVNFGGKGFSNSVGFEYGFINDHTVKTISDVFKRIAA